MYYAIINVSERQAGSPLIKALQDDSPMVHLEIKDASLTRLKARLGNVLETIPE